MSDSSLALAKNALSLLGGLRVANLAGPAKKRRCLVLAPSLQATGTPTALPTGVELRLDGTLIHPSGSGLASRDAATGAKTFRLDPPRLVALPGPGCTLLDVATALLPVLKDATPAISAPQLACALLGYNLQALQKGATPLPTTPPDDPPEWNWDVGDFLALPIEVKLETDSSGTVSEVWETNIGDIRMLANLHSDWEDLLAGRSGPHNPGTSPRALDQYRVQELSVPGNLHHQPDLDSRLTSPLDVQGIAAEIAYRLLRNPFREVFWAIEALGRIGATDPGNQGSLAAQVAETIGAPFLRLLGGVSGGNAVLRRVYAILETTRETDPAMAASPNFLALLKDCADALGLVPDPENPGNWLSWRRKQHKYRFGPRFLPVEPPLADPFRMSAGPGNKAVATLGAMALGRHVAVTRPRSTKSVPTALSLPGDQAPLPWIHAHESDTTDDFGGGDTAYSIRLGRSLGNLHAADGLPVSEAKTLARMRLAGAISVSEGRFDSCQFGDGGVASFGIQQWIAKDDGNLTVLWEKFRTQAPDLFDLFFGIWGLDTLRWIPDGVGREALHVHSVAASFAADLDLAKLSTAFKKTFPKDLQPGLDKFVARVKTAGSLWHVVDPSPQATPTGRIKYVVSRGPSGKLDIDCAPPTESVVAGNPHGLAPDAPLPADGGIDDFPTYATFVELPVSVAKKDASGFPITGRVRLLPGWRRRKWFGDVDGGASWCARARMAALCSPQYDRAQLHLASWRLALLQLRQDGKSVKFPLGTAGSFSIAQLFPTWVGAAMVLDQHVNLQGMVVPDIKAAIAQAGQNPVLVPMSPPTIDVSAKWYRKFLGAYISGRHTFDTPKRNRDILSLHRDPADPADDDKAFFGTDDPMDPETSPVFPGW